MTSPQFHPATPWQRRVRKLRAFGRGWLGLTPFTVEAQGAHFVVGMTDHIDRFLAFYGMWEQTQLEKLAAVSAERRIDVFLDVGANAGFYSIMFATKGLADRIIAFEPDPGNYGRLQANIEANGLGEKVEAVPLAIGDQDSEVMLYEGSKANRGESTIVVPEQTPQEVTFQIRQARLDDLYEFAGQNIIMKMDVEGYEFQALAGMERTLRENACHLQIEHYGDEDERLRTILEGWGYRFLYTEDIDHIFTNMPETGSGDATG